MLSMKSVVFPSIYSYHHFSLKMCFNTKAACLLNAARGVEWRGRSRGVKQLLLIICITKFSFVYLKSLIKTYFKLNIFISRQIIFKKWPIWIMKTWCGLGLWDISRIACKMSERYHYLKAQWQMSKTLCFEN